MPIDIHGIFKRGGKGMIDLLDYCVRSVQMDPVFVFLVQEYRSHPTTSKAVALYDVFCAPEALARITAHHLLPPLNLGLPAAIQPLKDSMNQAQRIDSAASDSVKPPLLPAKHLFDFVVRQLDNHPECSMKRVIEHYDPTRTPSENLPGGKMTPGQRAFVENIWEPKLRPHLVSAGFWRIANIA